MVGIVCFWDRYATPYLQKYELMLQEAGVPYEILFWNRESQQSTPSFREEGNEVYLDYKCRSGKRKLYSFFVWSRQIQKLIRKKNYSHLILLSTVPAVLLIRTAIHNYNNRYIFDIRDYTLEKHSFFRKMVMKLVEHSCVTTISSKGFMKWLDKSPKIMPNHNVTVTADNGFTAPSFSKENAIRFSFVGNVRLDTQTEAMLKTLGYSEKFQQHYYGRILKSCNIESLIEENHLTNVSLHGPFDVSQKETIYKNTDLINTVYANAEREEDIPLGDKTPLPNRLYDAIIFYRPLVTSKGTYLAELSEDYNLGINVNGFDKDIESKILQYTQTFDREKFMEGCNRLKREVLEEEAQFKACVMTIINNWKKYGC